MGCPALICMELIAARMLDIVSAVRSQAAGNVGGEPGSGFLGDQPVGRRVSPLDHLYHQAADLNEAGFGIGSATRRQASDGGLVAFLSRNGQLVPILSRKVPVIGLLVKHIVGGEGDVEVEPDCQQLLADHAGDLA